MRLRLTEYRQAQIDGDKSLYRHKVQETGGPVAIPFLEKEVRAQHDVDVDVHVTESV